MQKQRETFGRWQHFSCKKRHIGQPLDVLDTHVVSTVNALVL